MKIIFNNKNNDFTILQPTKQYVCKEGLEKILKKDVPEGATNIIIIGDKAMPKDRYFRSAWKPCRVMGILVSRAKAKNIHLENLKVIRNNKLEELDKESVKLISVKNNIRKLGVIEKKKQVLRDLPERIIADMKDMTDLEAIKQYKPEELL